ncbi:MAG: hypothetical protein L0K86_29170 [Actinomycetia bacterium]|nr:hypothetical protein [Actinomycetes bacterium]
MPAPSSNLSGDAGAPGRAATSFVLDSNLGLPIDHAPWSRFLAAAG